jgi:hypothetical protein
MATTTGTIVTMVIVMLMINVGLAFLQLGVSDLGSEQDFFSVDNSPYSRYVTSVDGDSVLDASYLPGSSTGVGDSSEDFNLYQQAKGWVQTSKISTSLGFVGNLVSQPGGFLRDVGVPSPIATAFQVIWGIVFIFLLMAWLLGR